MSDAQVQAANKSTGASLRESRDLEQVSRAPCRAPRMATLGSSRDPVVQRSSLSGAKGRNDHSAAAEGATGSGEQLPYFEAIQTAFGPHDVSTVKAHRGGRASQGAEAIGAEAYTSGENIVFGSQPSLRTTAHEAAHVVQQRSGISISGGFGSDGDSFEKQADAVADAVVAGQDASLLLGDAAGGRAQAGSSVVQRIPNPAFRRRREQAADELFDARIERRQYGEALAEIGAEPSLEELQRRIDAIARVDLEAIEREVVASEQSQADSSAPQRGEGPAPRAPGGNSELAPLGREASAESAGPNPGTARQAQAADGQVVTQERVQRVRERVEDLVEVDLEEVESRREESPDAPEPHIESFRQRVDREVAEIELEFEMIDVSPRFARRGRDLESEAQQRVEIGEMNERASANRAGTGELGSVQRRSGSS